MDDLTSDLFRALRQQDDFETVKRFRDALVAHLAEIKDESARRREHGEDAKTALALAKIAVLERYEDGRAALDLVEPLNAGIRARRARLREENE